MRALQRGAERTLIAGLILTHTRTQGFSRAEISVPPHRSCQLPAIARVIPCHQAGFTRHRKTATLCTTTIGGTA